MKIKHILKNEIMKLSHFNENHIYTGGRLGFKLRSLEPRPGSVTVNPKFVGSFENPL
jgi:hypothetical protein